MIDAQTAARLRVIGDVIAPDRARATDELYAPRHPATAPQDVLVGRDLSYGDHPRNRLDTFRPATAPAEPMPVLVFVHGGNFVAGDKHAEGSPFYDNVGTWAARHGMVGITINYRLAPQFQYPTALDDLAGVVGWVRANAADLGADPEHIVLMGASAGAVHVASYLAERSGGVAGAVLLSGLYDLAGLPREPVLNAYYGPVGDIATVSPLPRLAGTSVPLMVVVSELDPPGHQNQYVQLCQAVLSRQGRLPRMCYLAGHNHFSEVLHLGTDDDALGVELEHFVKEDTMSTQAMRESLEQLGETYRQAYARRDPSPLPIAAGVRFTENNVELPFPDGSWDAITEELGPALTFADPETGGIGIYTAIMMNDTPGFLAARLRVERGRITEIEHMLSTSRGVSGPPTPFGKVDELAHQPVIASILSPGERSSRDEALAVADGYFQTLSRNDGVLHTRFADTCYRIENGYQAAPKGAATDFLLGRYRFNERVRREWIMVDEARGICLARGFIDHKGLMHHYELTDGTTRESPFREPHTWSLMEMFKIKNGEIAAVEAVFISSPYYSTSPWATSAQIEDVSSTWNGAAVLLKDRFGSA